MKEIREIAKDIVSGKAPDRSAIREVLAKYLGKKLKEQLAQGDRVVMGDREGIIIAIDSSDPSNLMATVQWIDDNSTSQHPLSALTPKAPDETKPSDKTSPEQTPVEPPPGEAPDAGKTEQEDDDDDEEDEDNVCPACGGSGRDEEGNECPVCGGTGYTEESVSPKIHRMDHQAIRRALSKYLTMESTKSMVYENAFRSLFYEAYDLLARASDLYGRYPKSEKVSALRTETLNYIADLSALISELYADGYVQESDVKTYFEAMEAGGQTLDARIRTLADYPETIPGKGEDEIPPDMK